MMTAHHDPIEDVLSSVGITTATVSNMAARRTDFSAFSPRPVRSDLLHELSEFLLRLDDLCELARSSNDLASVVLPLRRLSDDLIQRADVASVHVVGRMTHAYSLAMQEAAMHLEQARGATDLAEWLGAAEQTRSALQRAVVRVRRIYD